MGLQERLITKQSYDRAGQGGFAGIRLPNVELVPGLPPTTDKEHHHILFVSLDVVPVDAEHLFLSMFTGSSTKKTSLPECGSSHPRKKHKFRVADEAAHDCLARFSHIHVALRVARKISMWLMTLTRSASNTKTNQSPPGHFWRVPKKC